MSAVADWPGGSSRSIHIPLHIPIKAFFITLRGTKTADWNEECDRALMAIKQYLTELLILASLKVGYTLYLYLAVSETSVNAALFKEDENRKQRPIFLVRKSLSEAETRYTFLNKSH